MDATFETAADVRTPRFRVVRERRSWYVRDRHGKLPDWRMGPASALTADMARAAVVLLNEGHYRQTYGEDE